jgi:ABC-2 type transport system permease protein
MMTSITAAARSTFAPRLPRRRAVAALLRRDYLIRASYRAVLVLDLFIGVLDVAVYYFISQTFKGGATASLGPSPSYFAFALVGISVTTVITATSTGVANRIREEQLTGTLEALLTQPVTAVEMSLGMCGLSFLFATFRVALYLIVGGVLFGLDFSNANWMGFGVVLTATATAMSAVGIFTAAMVMVVKRGQTIAGLILFAMGLLGGAFFPVSVLPDWLQAIGHVVPQRFAFDGLRQALYAGNDWELDALALVGFSLVTVPLAVWLFGRAILFCRRTGSIAQY